MEFIIDSWPLWFMLVLTGVACMKLLGNNRGSEVHPGMATTSEDFSMKSTFLSFRSGEAALFFTALFTMACFALLAISLSKSISGLFPE